MRFSSIVFALVTLAALLRSSASAANFYIPGIMAREYYDGEEVRITVNSLRAVSAAIPYDHYHLPFCRPQHVFKHALNVGQILAGDMIQSSVYSFGMNEKVTCRIVVCDNTADVIAQMAELKSFIDQGYRGDMIIDNLPGFTPPPNSRPLQGAAAPGYAIGVPASHLGKTLLNNHLAFEIRYHQPEGGPKYVVGFHIRPRSIMFGAGTECDEGFNLDTAQVQPLELDTISETNRVTWSYSVTWVEDKNTTWATRWDDFLDTFDSSSRVPHIWISVVNGSLIVFLLFIVAGLVLIRSLHKDCRSIEYDPEDPEDVAEEAGWMRLHSEVFRPPPRPRMLSVAVGSGAQMILLAVVLLAFSLLGLLSPANRGGMLSAAVLCFVLVSTANGYVTSRMVVTLTKQQNRNVVIFGSGMLFPGALFACFLVINLVNWYLGASNAVRFKTIVVIVLLWVACCIPLNALGAMAGFRRPGNQHPCSVAQVPRTIPPLPWWLSLVALHILPPVLPFAVLFLELRFVFSSLWQGYVYYTFPRLAVVLFVWAATVMLTTICAVYHMLVSGDHRWWWRSFIIGGGLGVHVYAFAIWFYFTFLKITTMTGTLIFFVYMGFFAAAYGLAAGTIGFLTSYAFVRRIYGNIQV